MLTGTLIIDGKATAFLRENAGGKSRRVAQGEQINGMMVAEVKPDRVKLTLGDESEDLVLKVAIGPRPRRSRSPRPLRARPRPPAVAAAAPACTADAERWPNAAARSRRPRPRRPRLPAGRRRLNAPPPGAYMPPSGALRRPARRNGSALGGGPTRACAPGPAQSPAQSK